MLLVEALTTEHLHGADRRRGDGLEHASAPVGHPVDELGELDVAGVGAGHGLAGDRAVEDRARGGEAHRAGGDGLGDQPAHLGDVVGGGVLVAHAALSHHLEAQRPVGQLRRDVERVATRPEEVEVLREALPRAPRDPLREGTARDVLHPFHQLDQRRLLARRARSEAHAAVAHDERGDPVAERRVELIVPRRLPVVVRVHVDPARRHDGAVGVDRAVALETAADGGDAPVVDRDVAGDAVGPGAVHDRPAPDHQLMCHVSRPLRPGPLGADPPSMPRQADRDPDRPRRPRCYPVSGSGGAGPVVRRRRRRACTAAAAASATALRSGGVKVHSPLRIGVGDVPAAGFELVAGVAEPLGGLHAGGVGGGPVFEVVVLEPEPVGAALAGTDRVLPLQGGALRGPELAPQVDDLLDVVAFGEDGGDEGVAHPLPHGGDGDGSDPGDLTGLTLDGSGRGRRAVWSMRTMILASAPTGHRLAITAGGQELDGGVVGVGLGGFAPALGPGLAEEAVGAVADGVVDPRHLGDGPRQVEVPGDPVGVGPGPAGPLGMGPAVGGLGVGLGVDPGAAALVLELPQRPVLRLGQQTPLRPRIRGRRTGDRFGLPGRQLAPGHRPGDGRGGPRAAGPSRPAAPRRPWTSRCGGPASPRPCGRRRPATPRTPPRGRRPGS